MPELPREAFRVCGMRTVLLARSKLLEERTTRDPLVKTPAVHVRFGEVALLHGAFEAVETLTPLAVPFAPVRLGEVVLLHGAGEIIAIFEPGPAAPLPSFEACLFILKRAAHAGCALPYLLPLGSLRCQRRLRHLHAGVEWSV
eukprot:4759545-Pleurochrysis_carterae.AAC.1